MGNAPQTELQKVQAAAAAAMAQIPGGVLGTDLFREVICRVPLTAMELCLIRDDENGMPEFYLTQRPEDQEYGGQWHFPGTYPRKGESIADQLTRLCKGELGMISIYNAEPIGEVATDDNVRGLGRSRLYIATMFDVPDVANGGWYTADNLPHPMVTHHETIMVPAFVAYYTYRRLVPNCFATLPVD